MSADPAAQEKLARAKQQLLERLMRQRNLAAPADPDELRRGSTDQAPLSFAQQQLWFLDQMEPGSSLYNIAVAVRLRGTLDTGAFTGCLQRLLERNESLRTSFRSREGEPVQHIAASVPLLVNQLDLSALPAGARQRAAEQLVAREAARPFDLRRAPLLRAQLLRLDEQEHVLSLVVHHIVCDGWSLGLLTGQLRNDYQRVVAGGAATGPSPTAAPETAGITYADFVTWQRTRYGADGLAAELEHWRTRLAGAPTLLELPGERPRPSVQSFRGAHSGASWQAGERAAVQQLSRQVGTSDFMTLLAAFAVVLARHSASDDLVIGVPIAGRTRPEVQDVVGLFVNTVPVRVRVDDRISFRKLLQQVRADTLDAYDHQDVPFDRIVDAVVPERALSHSPLVQVMFELRSDPTGGPAAWPGLQLLPFAEQPLGDTAKFDLTVTAADAGDGYELSVEYATDLFDRAGIDDLVRHFRRLLAQALAQPDAPVGQLDLLDRADTDHLLIGLNPPGGTAEDPTTLVATVLERARNSPDAIAVVHGERYLSYGALLHRATRFATVLARHGAGPEHRVGVCLAKRPEFLIGLLATALAGAGYVPMDPSYPPQRVGFMLADSGIRLLITDDPARSGFAAEIEAAGVTVLDVDRLGRDADQADRSDAADRPVAVPALDSLAYLIYTSGSTGTPRGVQVSHRNLAAALESWRFEYGLTPADRHLQLASPAFDVFTGDLTRALGSGAALVLVDRDLLLDPAGLAQLADEQQVTCAEFVPVVLRHLAAELDRQGRRLPTLRLLVAGSDAWNAGDHARAGRVGGPRTRVINSYGLTEATVDSTYFEGEVGGAGDIPAPIGRPMRHARAYVLDRAGRPSPLGVPGELYIGGPGVGRGYLNRPGRTAGSFVPDPFAGRPGARLYRTGDRARWRRSGELEFLGRLDHQIKLRGFRIELGEVQAVLATHPGVRSALALVRSDAGGTDRLVAYVVPDGPADPDGLTESLRAVAADRLPDYMVPSAIMLLGEFPLTPNGKLDRKALPDPRFAEATGGGGEPATESERVLARVWAEILGRERVGVEDNFFSLGGDSIISLQVVARSRAAGWAVTPKQVFEHQTVRGLAAVATPAQAAGDGAEQGIVSGQLPLTAIQHELLAADLPAPHHYNLSVLLAAREPVDPVALSRAVTAVLRHHDALRLRFTRNRNGEWQQYQCGAETVPAVPVTVIDLAGLDPAMRVRAIDAVSATAQASFGLSDGLLLRAVHFVGGEPAGDRLLLAAHHLAVDGVSWRILLEDLDRGYRSALAGEPIRLPAKTVSFRDWARRVREVADAPATQAESGYWLSVADAITPLPRDGVATAGSTGTVSSGDSVHVRVPADITRALLQEVPASYSTAIDDALLSALAQALESWTGSRSIVVDSERHGRDGIADELDVSRTVGWFTSTHPVLLDLGAARDQGAMLRRVKEQLRAVPRQGVGWGLLREVSANAPDALRDAPRSEVAFNYLGQFDSSFDRAALWQPAPENGGANHDPDEPREYLIEVTALVTQGSLEFVWSYSPQLHRRERVQAAAERLVEVLAAIVRHCADAGSGGHTPADFPLTRLRQDELDALLADDGIDDLYPLSPLQQGMIFHGLAEPGSGTYLEQFTASLQGDLDTSAFRQAWQDIIDRHSALRASFHWAGLAEPVQAVHRQVEPEWVELDWRSQPDADSRWQDWLTVDRARGFDLQSAPLLRFALIRVGEDTLRFAFSHHHVLLDGWSFRQVLTEVLTAYAARRHGEPAALAPVRQYRDHIAWLAGEAARSDRAEEFWRAELRGFRPGRLLGTGRPDGEQASLRQLLDPDRSAALGSFAREHQLTLNTLVQAAWAFVLGRSSGIADVVHGMTLAGRPADLPGVEDIVGLFINTVPIRTALPEAVSVLDWLRQVQAHLLDVRQYETTPLVQIKQYSELSAAETLFDSLVVFENYPVTPAAASQQESGVTVGSSATFARTNFALSLTVVPADEVSLELIHDRGVVSSELAAQLLDRFGSTLDAFVTQPAAALARLELVTAGERAQLVSAGQGAEPALAGDDTIVGAFARQVAAHPLATALIADGAEVSYRQLDEQSGRLAGRLIRARVRPGDRVALLVERGLDQVAATLATLKAGAAYVPLDARYPDARLATVLERSGATAVWADGVHAARARALATVPVLVTTETEQTAPAADPGIATPPDELAYVIFTSGSTGEPKGVAVTQRNVLALAFDSAFDAAHRRVLVHSPHAFDASTYELWVPLLAGGTAVLADPGELRVDRIASAIVEHGVTAVFLTTGLFRVLAEQSPHALRGVQQLWTGGDAVPADAIRRVQQACPELVVVDVYGPTETTTFATCHRLDAGQDPPTSVPIGRPMDGLRAYVLDAGLRPSPACADGELHLGGTGLARGYLGDPALTADRFVPDPFGPPGARMYRTGDITAWTPEHTLRFVGRRDEQVKVRGFRIELDEIETVLRRLDAVRDAAVTAPAGGHGDRVLVAHVVADPGADAAALRTHCAALLPDYMVPARVQLRESLPLTGNGKLDRRTLLVEAAALLADGGSAEPARSGRELDLPQTPVEAVVLGLFEQAIGRTGLGVHEDFFLAGGHSLAALRLVGQLREVAGSDVALAELYRAPTAAALAAALARPATDWPATLVPLRKPGAASPLICIHPKNGTVFCYSTLARALPGEHAVLGVQSVTVATADPAQTSIEALAARYLDDLLQVQPAGPYHLCGYSLGGMVAYEIARRLHLRGAEVATLFLLDCAPRLAGPPFPDARTLDAMDDADFLVREFGEYVELEATQLRGLSAPDRLHLVAARMEAAGLPAEHMDLNTMARYVEIARAHTRAAISYDPLPYPGRAVLLRCHDAEEADEDPSSGWAELIADLEVFHVPGTHVTMLDEPNVADVVAHLTAALPAGGGRP